MKKLFLSAPALAMAFLTSAATAGYMPEESPGTPRLRDVVRAVMPGVVNIHSTVTRTVGGEKQTGSSIGTGFVYDARGDIVTNSHVVKDASDIEITFSDSRIVKATVVGKDDLTDIAVVRVKSGVPLSPEKLGDSDKLSQGDGVFAIGSPLNLSQTVTAGIVSAFNRDHIEESPYDNFIQTDAAINRGNSGGPLFDRTGHVIGMNTAIFSQSGGSMGLGFAIPVNMIKRVAQQLIAYQEVHWGYMDVKVSNVNEETAQRMRPGAPRGAVVVGIGASGPAQRAGLALNDIIISLNGKPVRNADELPRLIGSLLSGTKADIGYLRYGKKHHVIVRLGRMPDSPATPEALKPQPPEPGQPTPP